MSTEEMLLEVKNLSKQFGGIKAVDNVNLQIRKGEIISVIGPNGAGKTTVFNLLTGIYKPDHGEIYFKGEAIQDLPPIEIVHKGIARTFQNIRLFHDMRVIENVLVGTHHRTKYTFWDSSLRTKRFRKEEDERVIQAIRLLQLLKLDHRRDEYAANLPYGVPFRTVWRDSGADDAFPPGRLIGMEIQASLSPFSSGEGRFGKRK